MSGLGLEPRTNALKGRFLDRYRGAARKGKFRKHLVNQLVVSQKLTAVITQGQFDAMVDFTYSEGQGSFRNSTLLRMVNKGDFAGAAAQFPFWNKAGGVVQEGLERRRKAEAAMFMGAV